jgi:NAD-dependent deacetylase
LLRDDGDPFSMYPPLETEHPNVALDQAAEWLRQSRRVAVLTGAGVSAESGLATFRGTGGLWEGQCIEDVATPSAFQRNPALVWRFYNARRAALRTAQPNPGHRALVALEEHFAGQPSDGEPLTLITQNVDGLHQAAGSRRVLELHGSLRRVRCTVCSYKADRGDEELPDLPHCAECDELLRPDVVWFEEMLPMEPWKAAAKATAACQCFLVIGTSAVVYPAAGLIDAASEVGAVVIEVNPEATFASRRGGLGLRGPSGVILPQLVQRLGSA